METTAVVFDLYGTLVYFTRECKPYRKLFHRIFSSEKDILEAKNLVVTENFANFGELVKRLMPELEVDCSEYEHDLELDISAVVLYPEVIGVLKELKEQGFKLGLISNLATPYKKVFFNLGLDKYFDKTVFSCDVGMVKPDQKIFQIAVDLLGVKPEQILMTGDKFGNDVEAPRKAGLRAVHLNRTGMSLDGMLSLVDIFQFL